MNMLLDVARLLRSPFPENTVPLWWLLSRPSSIDRRFGKRARIKIFPREGFQEVSVNSERFVWPVDTPINALLQIASELQNPHHPHQYLWGSTQIRPDDVVLDIGACEGSFAARARGLGGRVIAVEPSQAMGHLIQALFALRGWEAPVIVNHLLGPSRASLHYLEHQTNPGRSRIVLEPVAGSYPVSMLTLDDFVASQKLDRLDFIKCDAEGADVDIVKSGRRTLQRFRPKLAICTYHGDHDFVELYHFLSELGYQIQGKGFLHAGRKFRVVMLHAS